MTVITSFESNLVKTVGPQSNTPCGLKCQRNSRLTLCACTKFSMPLRFQFFSVNHSFIFGRWEGGQILELRSPFVLHLNKDLEINFGYVFKKNDLKDAVNIIIRDLPWRVNESVVSYVFCSDTRFTIFIPRTSVSNTVDALYW